MFPNTCFLYLNNQYIRNRQLVKNKKGNNSPIKEIGHKTDGLINGDKYERIKKNKKTEFIPYIILFKKDKLLIFYFLLDLKVFLFHLYLSFHIQI